MVLIEGSIAILLGFIIDIIIFPCNDVKLANVEKQNAKNNNGSVMLVQKLNTV